MCVCGGGGGVRLLVQFLGLRIERHYQVGVYVAVVSVKLNINKKLNKGLWHCYSIYLGSNC